MTLKTKGKIKRDKRDAQILASYNELKGDPANMKSAIVDELMKRYKTSMATIYRAIK